MAELAEDPVCHMKVDPARARAQAEYAGKTYYFCCAGCAQKFEAEPERYLAPKAATGAGLVQLGAATGKGHGGMAAPPSGASLQVAAAPAGPGSAGPVVSGPVYTCPMDPEVRQPGPGACPKCGMDLEPEV
ncbi:MAG TPA: YHS domain-containing protein, partial [Terriglobales bacterium]|nr:YHS domain-containing protein [Terriglobales bacterium]